MGFLELPAELYTAIFTHLGMNELVALSQVSTPFYHAVTPIIYKTITLTYEKRLQLCCAALISSTNNVGTFINTFELPHEVYIAKNVRKALKRDLSSCLENMVHLQHFTCMASDLFSPRLFDVLCMHSYLRSIAVAVGRLDSEDKAAIYILSDLYPLFPELVSITIKIISREALPEELEEFFQQLIQLHANQLKKLSLTAPESSHFITPSLLDTTGGFPELETLTVTLSCLYSPALMRTPKVHELRVILDDTLYQDDSQALQPISKRSFPELTILTCPSEAVPIILYEGAGRPVRKICLDDGQIEEGEIDVPVEEPDWNSTTKAIELMHNSTKPVVELSFWSRSSILGESGCQLTELIHFLGGVEKLTIWCDDEGALGTLQGCNHLGGVFFAHLPHLHTFLLNGDPSACEKVDLRFSWDGDISEQYNVLSAWEMGCPQLALKKVAFSLDTIWQKKGERWEYQNRPWKD